MKRTFLSLVILTFLSVFLFNSCDPVETSVPHWQLTSSEIYGVKPAPLVADQNYQRFPTFPFSTIYDEGTATHTYSGTERNIVRSDFSKITGKTETINFIWSQPPATILPDTEFTITVESKGTTGNGRGVSSPSYYSSLNSWPAQSFRNGPKTATLKFGKPDSDPNRQKMKIILEMSSGVYYRMEWWYVYEWKP